ncbi:MAG: glutamine-synthetase adenylyltransferase, partial [Gammaproteobacteria bacterium]|nr:glutamine-synthetase adenylyltransferase [Gammaproteobacteria bacterium]
MSRLPFLTDDATCPEPASGERARASREEWLAAAVALGGADESFANALAGDRRACAFLDGVFGNAPALGRALAREPAQLREVAEHGPDAAFENVLDEIAAAARQTTDRRVFARLLRGARRRASLTAALADIAGAWPLEIVTAALTRLADAVLASALDHLLRDAAARGTLVPPDGDEPAASGLTVFGVGGLGAGELTYSSELSLLVLFDPERVRHQGRGEP